MNQKGFAKIAIIVLVVILAGGAIYFVLLKTRPVTPIPIPITSFIGKWGVTSVEENGAQIVSEGSSAIIEFFDNGTYKASGGCNEMSISSYTVSDSRISFEVGGTKKRCLRSTDTTKNTVEFWDLAKVYSYELINNGNVLLLRYKTDRGVEGIFRLRKFFDYPD